MDQHQQEELRKKILKNIQDALPSWKAIINHEVIHLTRLSGLSNACYRVKISPDIDDENFMAEFKGLEPQSLLYRVYQCPIVDWAIENELFQVLSEQGIGPKLYFQNTEYRIEGFFLSRPLTIWEMRNQVFMETFAERICEFNYNKAAQETMLKFAPMTSLYVDQALKNWAPKLESKMELIKEKNRQHPHVMKILEHLEETFLFPGYCEYFQSLIPRDSDIVLCHNDTQENNILTSLEDNTHLLLIDFEYTGWNPRAMDLANYFNETMLDNAYPLANGIKLYINDFIPDQEQEFLLIKYLTSYYNRFYQGDKTQQTLAQYLEQELPKLKQEVNNCLLLNNFFWGIWSLMMINDEKLGDDKIYNYDFAEYRCIMYKYIKGLYFKGDQE